MKPKLDKQKAYIIGGVGGFILLSFIAYKIYKKNRDNKAIQFFEEAELLLDPTKSSENSEAFNTEYWKTIKSGEVITESSAQDVAVKIRNAFSYWGGIDEEALNSIYRNLKNKASMSRVADQFAKTYDTDLLYALKNGTWTIRGEMDDEEMTKLMAIINEKD